MSVSKIIDGLMSSGVAGGLAGGAASGLLVQSLSSKKGRKMAGTAAKLGGAAVVGGLAWKAYQHYRGGEQSASAPAEVPMSGSAATRVPAESLQPSSRWTEVEQEQFLPRQESDQAHRDLLILRSMISAAHADGHIDNDEKLRVFARLEQSELSQADKGLLLEELGHPLPQHVLAEQANTPALAAEVYLAALLMLDESDASNRQYLEHLSLRLNLPPEMIAELRNQARPQPATLPYQAQVA